MEEGLLVLAEQCLEARHYDAACATFLHLLRRLPTDDFPRRSRISDLLVGALHDWGSEADRLNDSSFQLLMKAYHESLDVLSSSALLPNNLGGLLFRLDTDRQFVLLHICGQFTNLKDHWSKGSQVRTYG